MRLEKKQLRLLQAAVSIAIVYYLLQLLDWRDLQRLLVSGILPELWPGPLILLLGLVLAAERWRTVLSVFGVSLLRREAFVLYLIGNFYSVVLPGVLGGDVVRAAMCRTKTGANVATVLASVGIERGLGLWGVTIIGTVGALAVVAQMSVSFEVITLLLSPLMAVSIPLAAWAAYIGANHVSRIKTVSGLVKKVINILQQFAGRVGELTAGLALRTLLFSTAFQASEILIFFYFGHVMQIDVPFVFYLFVIPLVYLATVLPVSLGGIGVREGVLVWFLSIAGTPASDAVLLAFLVYLNRVLVGAIGGVVQAAYRFGR